ncbi:MAG: Isopentenyl phosphate kinase [Methanomassiliicoccales archaeon PtaB.Bin215]|nr:MAG: Isopentenyl phosphate kinase [Methanomassiliicoccales archaeon PtaB.Bin215]
MRDISVTRAVIKIGTNTICDENGQVDSDYLDGIARQVLELERMGIQSIIVTSGAIGSGSSELKLDEVQKDIPHKQACAAVGQAALMLTYREVFARHNKSVGQLLLTYDAFSDRKVYLNLRKTVDALFELGVIPIVNENDVISTDEIGATFGDNDKLSALVASKVDADLLILLTDVDGLYDRNPETDPDARFIDTVDEITKDIEMMAGGGTSGRSKGGMKSKINAARIAMGAGCNTVIANGRADDVIVRVVRGEVVGTFFSAKALYTNRERWILYASPRGKILVDAGAEEALRDGGSLLPCGITSVEGRFKEGDVVRLGGFAKGVVNFPSGEIMQLKAECEKEKRKGNGKVHNGSVVMDHCNIVFHE